MSKREDKAPETLFAHLCAVPVLECKRCAHRWIPRKALVPKMCAKCKRTNWNSAVESGSNTKFNGEK